MGIPVAASGPSESSKSEAARESLGKYELIRRLATGGMAEIFLAKVKGLEGFEKIVVVKRILPQLAGNPEFVQMFLDEARIAATLHHSNIVQVYDIGSVGGSYFFSMEFLHGEDVRTITKKARSAGRSDMPIQHGSDAVLRRMRRPERGAGIRATVARIRDAVPDVALRTTCIVGFPGETEDDLTQLLDLLEEVQFDRVGAFTYSAQEGTRAAELPDDVPDVAKRERLERLMERQRLITSDRYERIIGTHAQAIVDWPDGGPPAARRADGRSGGARARLACQADDIDGITMLNRSDLAAGAIVEVRVDDVVDDYDFAATVHRVISTPDRRATAGRRTPLPLMGATSTAGSYGR